MYNQHHFFNSLSNSLFLVTFMELIHACLHVNAYYFSACDDGKYIHNRMCVQCPGHCKNGEPCNKLTGRCDHGCDTHWTGDFCQRMY